MRWVRVLKMGDGRGGGNREPESVIQGGREVEVPEGAELPDVRELGREEPDANLREHEWKGEKGRDKHKRGGGARQHVGK
ncbi:hypothetical protein SLA2020_495180 [Shorea laevis]